MHRLLWSIVMFVALVVCGCNSSEQPTSQTAPLEKKSTAVESTAKEMSKETATAPASEPSEQDKQNVNEGAGQTTEPSGSVPAGPATPATSTAGQDVKNVGTIASDTAKQADTLASGASTPEVVQKTATGAAQKTVIEAEIPDVIVLKASNGDVTFPHRVHAQTHECQTCHGDGTPSAFGINKDIAHKLCKDCHKTVGAGPTACNGCHKK